MEVTLHTLLLKTELPGIELFARGKVRDLYALGDRLLIVATDRISAFDVVLPSGIPDKGRVLTQLSVFWFEFLRDLVPTHFLTATVDEFPQAARRHRAQLESRAMLVRRTRVVPIECVVRGYLGGLRLERVSPNGPHLRRATPGGTARVRAIAGTDFHPGYQSHQRPRPEHQLRPNGAAGGR